MSDIVTFETDGHVAVITLNRPEARNAVNGEVAQGLEAGIDRLEDDLELWVGVLAANTAGQQRPVFSAGADLKEISAGNAAALVTRRGGFAGFTYRQRRKPVIAAIDGLATAGGCEIALAADIVVATTRSAFGLAEVKRNLVAGAGGLFRLPRAVGQGPAMEMILTGEPMPAERAYQLGLVARLAEPGQALEVALAIAAQIAKAAPLAVWESRAVVLAAASESDETLKRMTDTAMGVVMSSEDLGEGLTAFIEKREPVWKGR
jgi:enoyl-CoA hydratase/carnithine racemase